MDLTIMAEIKFIMSKIKYNYNNLIMNKNGLNFHD